MFIARGSPSGATISTHTGSPGTHPISIKVSWKSLSSCSLMTALVPAGNSDNLIICPSCTFMFRKGTTDTSYNVNYTLSELTL